MFSTLRIIPSVHTGEDNLKKKMVSVLILIVAIILILFSVRYLRSGVEIGINNKDAQARKEEMQKMATTPGQSKADEKSIEFAKILKKKTGQDIDPRNIVSTGKPLVFGEFLYEVSTWNVSKEYPGYEPPKGRDISKASGAMLDEKGNIINDFTYVTVNISAKNLRAEEVSDLVWGNMRLRIFDARDYMGEMTYLGEQFPREYGHQYNRENFQGNETKRIALIFVVKDELLTNQTMYLEFKQNVVVEDSNYDVRRFIILN